MEWEGQRASAPSPPTSVCSQSTGGTASSKDKVAPYKQLPPSAAVMGLSNFSDQDLFRKGGEELVRLLRILEHDYKGLVSEHGALVKDVNRRLQILVLEARGLREINQRLQDDNQELQDLCCFLDDDRQKSRKLAREWQRFGRYTASVMHSEVAAYQDKLTLLEEHQARLLQDNTQLKELCLFLDHERSMAMADRDEGDGSSSSTVPGVEEAAPGDSDGQLTPTPTQQAYIQQLELRIQRLEKDKQLLTEKAKRSGEGDFLPMDKGNSSHGSRLETDVDQLVPAGTARQGATTPGGDKGNSAAMNKPEAVVHAMKVLQVHEQLERHRDAVNSEDLGDTEKAIVREMCNVVWRKLGDVGEYPPHTSPSPASTLPQPAPVAPALPYRPHSAASNPHTPQSHTPSLSTPASPLRAHADPQGGPKHSPSAVPPKEASAPGGMHAAEKRSPQGAHSQHASGHHGQQSRVPYGQQSQVSQKQQQSQFSPSQHSQPPYSQPSQVTHKPQHSHLSHKQQQPPVPHSQHARVPYSQQSQVPHSQQSHNQPSHASYGQQVQQSHVPQSHQSHLPHSQQSHLSQSHQSQIPQSQQSQVPHSHHSQTAYNQPPVVPRGSKEGALPASGASAARDQYRDQIATRDSGGAARQEPGPAQQSGNRGALPPPSYPLPTSSAQAAERPRQLQPPPPYSSAKMSPTFPPGSRAVQHPPHYQPPPHPQPASRPSQQPLLPPRYQQRTHPLQSGAGYSAQNPPLPRSASASSTYYVGRPTTQTKSLSSSALQLQSQSASSVPAASYLYSQPRGASPAGGFSQFRSHSLGEQGARSSDQGRAEWKQTYLDN